MSTRANEKAPGAGGIQSEGDDQKPAEDSIWSQATRERRAAAAGLGTIAADAQIAIDDRPDPEATTSVRPTERTSARRALRMAEAVAGLPLIVQRTARSRRTLVWRTADGHWWRKGGIVQIKPHGAHPRAFVVTLYDGANADDAKYLTDVVSDARRGVGLELWDPVTRPEWADDLTFGYTASRIYRDPYVHEDWSGIAELCTDDLCMQQWHEDPLHQIEAAEGPGYAIAVSRYDTEPEWHVDVYANGASMTPDQVDAFANDLQWMRTECEKANARSGS